MNQLLVHDDGFDFHDVMFFLHIVKLYSFWIKSCINWWHGYVSDTNFKFQKISVNLKKFLECINSDWTVIIYLSVSSTVSSRSNCNFKFPRFDSSTTGLGRSFETGSSATSASTPLIQYMLIVPSWNGKSFSSQVSNFLWNESWLGTVPGIIRQSCCSSMIIFFPSSLVRAS